MRISSSHFLICAALASSIGWAVSVPDTEVQAKAREAVRQKIRELQGQVGASVVAPVPSAPADEAGIARAREAVRQQLDQVAAPPPEATDAATAKADATRAKKAAAAQAKADAEAAKAAARADAARAKEDASRAKQAEPRQLGMASGAGSLATQPYPAPESKEARLAELLKLYRADTITPAEYHTQRAAIVAGS